MKKVKAVLTLFLLLLSLTSRRVHADMGPKPSVNITFINAPSRYYVTLLSQADVYGPYHAVGKDDVRDMEVSDEAAEAYKVFAEYEDSDGFHFLEYNELVEDDSFSWGYYPPEVFKIAVYDPQTKQLSVSQIIKKEGFDSFYQVDLADGSFRITYLSKAPYHFLMFALRVVITVIVELLLGLLFGYRSGKEIRTILIVNLITQILLNGILGFLSYHMGLLVWVFFLPILEIAVTLIEMIVYLLVFKDHSKLKTVLYVIIANGLTYFLGMYGEMLFRSVV